MLKKIYEDSFPNIKGFIINNNGSEQDAKDVFQDGIVIIYRKIKNKTFHLNSSFNAYIFTVCRFIWIKKLSERKQDIYNQNEYLEYEGVSDFLINEYEKNEQYKLYQKHFNRLNEDCKKILKFFLQKISMKDIAIKMGIDSIKFVKQKKYKCKEQLVRYIKNDPKFLKIHER